MKKAITLLLVTYLFSSCIPFGHLESGRTIGKGITQMKGELDLFAVADISEENHPNSDILYENVPFGSLGMGYGLTDKTEVRASLSLSSFLQLEVKHQFVGDATSKFALSVGPGVSFNIVNQFGSTGDLEHNLHGIIHLPVYMSYHPNTKSYWFFNPEVAFLGVYKKPDLLNTIYWGSAFGYGIEYKNLDFSFGGVIYAPNVNPVLAPLVSPFRMGVSIKYLLRE